MFDSYRKGSAEDLLDALRHHGMIWVRGSARKTIEALARDGKVGYSATAICDNRTSRSHEEYHVWLQPEKTS